MKRIKLAVLDNKYLIEADWNTAINPILVDGQDSGQTVGDHKHKPESFCEWFIEDVLDYSLKEWGYDCCPNCGCEDLVDDDEEQFSSEREYECGGDEDGILCDNPKWWHFKEIDTEDEAKRAGQLALFPEEQFA